MHRHDDLLSHAHDSDPEHFRNLHNPDNGSTNATNSVSRVQLSSQSISDDLGSALPSTSHNGSSKKVNQPPTYPTPQLQSQKAFQTSSRGISRWTRVWRPQNAIIGLYALSIVLAVAHWSFFQYLDGRAIRPSDNISMKTTAIPQGYVTTILFLLITAFRAALIASVAVGLVEDLFQIQTNAFHLISADLYNQTPMLALIALFCWIVSPAFPTVRTTVGTCYGLRLKGQSDEIRLLTRSRLILGDIASLARPNGENSSYLLQFLSTTLECHSLNRTVEKIFSQDDFHSSRSRDQREELSVRNFSSLSELWSNADYDSMLEDPSITYRKPRGTGPERLYPPKPTQYSLNVTFAGGQQHISYNLSDKEPFPPYSVAFENFTGSYEQWVHLSDAMSIYFEFAANLNRSTISDSNEAFDPTNMTERSTSYSTSNGTAVDLCLLNSVRGNTYSPFSRPGFDPVTDLEFWPLSVFERQKTMRPENGERFIKALSYFDAEVAKELLINTTISALALGQHFDTIKGTILRSFNVYVFQEKHAFFLPYALSIGLAISFIALGFVVFFIHNKGVSAISGGFLQLLMTTTGRRLLERKVAGSVTLGGHENVTAELRAAEITFGELVTIDDVLPDGVLAEQIQREMTAEQMSSSDATLLDGLSVPVDTEKNESRERRAGFGLVQEVKRLQRRKL
ncbi:hypothetical protein OPT61_g273 [Boeremia exigua]|uniref:Uncharacterized protein n=1 Tax=Boeremia exigua TaxID=749465 RepID=A0ACC2IUP8_9PLEO|nr:hypothetical protein OPT61_g273 [Boeremia exigua]